MIRRATAADLETVVRLERAYYQFDGIEWNESVCRPALVQLLGDERIGVVALAEIAGRVVGYAVGTWGFDAEFGGRYVMLTELFVEAEHRGGGFGRKLLASVVEYARAGGASVIEGQVLRGNERARAFYRAWGFSFPDRLLMSLRL